MATDPARSARPLSAPLTRTQVESYLGALGVPSMAPGMAALGALVRAQVMLVPFENVSKLLYRSRLGLRGVPDLELYLDGVRRFHFGGTCYPNGFHFYRLLRTLGYDAALCGAAMPSGEDVHVVITVALAGRDLLVDVGYGARFLEPLPRDGERDVTVEYGEDRWVLRPADAEGRSRLDAYRGGRQIHGYRIDPTPRTVEHFDAVVHASFGDDATFMNAVMLARHGASESVAIYNLDLVRSTPAGCATVRLAGRRELVAAIEREFGIPAEVAMEAIAALGPLRDIHG